MDSADQRTRANRTPDPGAWIDDPTDDELADAALHGLRPIRRLHRMQRDLPVVHIDGAPIAAATRAFRPGEDDAAWLAVNNHAFAWHPDQSAWTVDDLHARFDEDWFDPEGFRVAETDGVMTGFCWTKVHRDTEPLVGEIFVIAVDDRVAPRGHGTALTVAGLDWLWSHAGTPVAMLYVESTNERALATYQRLGFEIVSTRVQFGAGAEDTP